MQFHEACRYASSAIIEYRAKNEIIVPEWIKEIGFSSERSLEEEIANLDILLAQKKNKLEKFEMYKSVLVTSGDFLVNSVKAILREYFELSVGDDEKYIEDCTILDGNSIRFVLEIKGVNGGIQRKHVTQVDNHRERIELGDSTRGVLIINDSMNVEGIAARKKINIHSDVQGVAEKLNVKVVRTYELIELMLSVETKNLSERKQELFSFLEQC